MKHVERVAQLSSTSWQGFKERLRSGMGGYLYNTGLCDLCTSILPKFYIDGALQVN